MSALLRMPELEKYELLEEIGHGGMATVFRARDRRLGREVAVKLIHRHLQDDVEAGMRFLREAKAIAKLRHPNIVEVYDISDEGENERYLVVELVRGVTLRALLKRQGRLEPELAAAVAHQVALGLEHAHRHGVVHRDVKPENVLLELPSGIVDEASREGFRIKVKLTDFGIAKLLDAQGVTSTGQVLGSPAHMAPEQIEGGEVDARTDVFGLGVLLYESMVGKLPFEGAHPAQVLRKVLDGEFIAPELAEPRVGAIYGHIVSRALSRDPSQRFASVQALVEVLTHELARLGFGEPEPLLRWLAPGPEYAGFSQRIVPELVQAGLRARAKREMSVAAEDFNRALAYRPGDTELLRYVSGLRRMQQLQRAAAFAGLALLVGGGLYAAVALRPAPVASARAPGAAVPSKEHSAKEHSDELLSGKELTLPATASPEVASAPAASGEAPGALGAPGNDNLVAAPDRVRQRRPVAPAPAPVPSEREVVVRITGAMGGTLRIDGESREWFGDVHHKLTVGPHRFEFVPPDETCCVASARTILVEDGDGAQQVVGDIPFREATLRVSVPGAERGVMTCPTLFSGEQAFPGERRVAMSRVRVEDTCVMRSESPAGSTPLEKMVTLRAGQTTVIPWP